MGVSKTAVAEALGISRQTLHDTRESATEAIAALHTGLLLDAADAGDTATVARLLASAGIHRRARRRMHDVRHPRFHRASSRSGSVAKQTAAKSTKAFAYPTIIPWR